MGCSFAEPTLEGFPCPCLEGYVCVSGNCQPSEGGYAFVQEGEGDFLLTVEAENFTSGTMNEGDHEWTIVDRQGASGNRALQPRPVRGDSLDADFMTQGPRADFAIDFQTAGQHVVWVRARPIDADSNAVYVGFADGDVVDLEWMVVAEWEWRSKTVSVPAKGMGTLGLWMHRDGLLVDKIVLTPSNDFDPSTFANGEGPPESPRRQL